MGIIPKKIYKKPKLKKGDMVLIVDMPDGPDRFFGKVSSVDSVDNQGKVKCKGDSTLFSDEGVAPNERAVRVPLSLRQSWNRSAFLRNASKLSNIELNAEMLLPIDSENEKNP